MIESMARDGLTGRSNNDMTIKLALPYEVIRPSS
jgi:hypothetical protein